jgi:hypothetical protein
VGQPVELQVAPASSGCSGVLETLTLVATAALPVWEPASVLLAADEGRLELRGQGLAGAQVFWRTKRDARLEREVCLEVTGSDQAHACVLPVRRGMPTDVSLYLLPAGARFGEGVLSVDAAGHQLAPADLLLRPSRVLLWGAYEFREPYFTQNEDGSPGEEVGRWALIFGPSISLGNIGTNL